MYRNLHQFLSHPDSRVLGLSYTFLSILYGTLFARFPEWLDVIQVNKAEFGLALLSMSIGALLFTPITTWIINRFQTGPATFWGMILMCPCFVAPVLAPNFYSLLVATFLLGMTHAWVNVTVNAAASQVEKRDKRQILSTCHAMFSIGGVLGSVSAGFLASAGLSIGWHLGILSCLLLLASCYIRPLFLGLPHAAPEQSRRRQWPSSGVLRLSYISFFIVMTEVAIMDWSTVYLQYDLKSSPMVKGLGFAGYSFAMALGRLYGDGLVTRLGSRKLVFYGVLIGIFGLVIAAFLPSIGAAIAGFTLVGLGFSCTVPSLYSASARVAKDNPALGVTAIATAGIIGIIIGRPMLGYIAEYWGMTTGFALLALLCLLAVGLSRKANFG
ncbi:MAG: MFS transporter [Bacteroidota bacterium]